MLMMLGCGISFLRVGLRRAQPPRHDGGEFPRSAVGPSCLRPSVAEAAPSAQVKPPRSFVLTDEGRSLVASAAICSLHL